MLFNEYPYMNLTDINLDWIIAMFKKLRNDIDDFVNINTIKYADPFIWDITRQYEMNTVVVDGLDGTAYISVRPVPVGVAITNSDYWTVIFNYGQSIDDLKSTIAYNEGSGTTATRAMSTGELVYVLGSLYKVTSDMPVGTAYVPGGNVTEYTVAQYIMDLVAAVAAESAARDAADTALGDRIDAEAQAREAADTALGDRIDAEAQAREAADTALGDRIDAEAQAREDADTALSARIDDLNIYCTPEDFGALGDGITDDTEAIRAALSSSYKYIVFRGSYKVTADDFDSGEMAYIAFRVTSGKNLLFAKGSNILLNTVDYDKYYIFYLYEANNVLFDGGEIVGDLQTHETGELNIGMGIDLHDCEYVTIHNMTIRECWGDGVYIGNDRSGYRDKYITLQNVTFDNCGRNGLSMINSEDVTVDSCTFTNMTTASPKAGIDVEINHYDRQTNKDLTIKDCTFRNNFMGLVFNWIGPNAGDTFVNNCIFDNNNNIKFSENITDLTAGNVNVSDCTMIGGVPISFSNKMAAGYRVYMNNCTVIHAQPTDPGDRYDGVIEWRTSTPLTAPQGNIDINNLIVDNTGSRKPLWLITRNQNDKANKININVSRAINCPQAYVSISTDSDFKVRFDDTCYEPLNDTRIRMDRIGDTIYANVRLTGSTAQRVDISTPGTGDRGVHLIFNDGAESSMVYLTGTTTKEVTLPVGSVLKAIYDDTTAEWLTIM